MKYLFFSLIFLISLTSCSSDDSIGPNSASINPPSWIIGIWNSEYVDIQSFEFTPSDIITIQGGVSISLEEQINFYTSNGQDVSIEETKTDDYYSLTANLPAGQSVTYSFDRISENSFIYEQGSVGGVDAVFIRE